MFQTELADKNFYKASISGMRLRLLEVQELNDKMQRIKATKELWDGYKEVDRVLHHQGLPLGSEIIWTKLISWHYDNPLARHFGIDKTREFVGRKYYWPSLRKDVEIYVKGCNVCLLFKTVTYKPYSNLQALLVLTYWWKDFSMDFVTGLLVSINWKSETYNSILVIVNRLTKMVYYKPVKVTINALGLAKVILDVVVWHHGLPNSIISDKGSLFISKFWFLLCYFFGIKQRLSTVFHLETDGQTKQQNSTMKAYLQAFVNFKQNNRAKLLLMAEFIYNNAENASTGHTPFELNCGYHLCVFFKEDTNLCS